MVVRLGKKVPTKRVCWSLFDSQVCNLCTHTHTDTCTEQMADDGEVSALVCDNGSGMVKVRYRNIPVP